MTKIPSDDILEGWYKLRIGESEKLKTVLELYNMETHQKKAGLDYHRLNTMVKRRIEQNLRIRNFEARNGYNERNAVVKNRGTKQRGQRTLGVVGIGKPTEQCSSSFRHDINKRAKLTQPIPSPRSSSRQSEKCIENQKSQRQNERLDGLARITSEELAPIHSVKSGILQNACSTSPRVVAALGKVLLG